jgi:hypothetical protein
MKAYFIPNENRLRNTLMVNLEGVVFPMKMALRDKNFVLRSVTDIVVYEEELPEGATSAAWVMPMGVA